MDFNSSLSSNNVGLNKTQHVCSNSTSSSIHCRKMDGDDSFVKSKNCPIPSDERANQTELQVSVNSALYGKKEAESVREDLQQIFDENQTISPSFTHSIVHPKGFEVYNLKFSNKGKLIGFSTGNKYGNSEYKFNPDGKLISKATGIVKMVNHSTSEVVCHAKELQSFDNQSNCLTVYDNITLSNDGCSFESAIHSSGDKKMFLLAKNEHNAQIAKRDIYKCLN